MALTITAKPRPHTNDHNSLQFSWSQSNEAVVVETLWLRNMTRPNTWLHYQHMSNLTDSELAAMGISRSAGLSGEITIPSSLMSRFICMSGGMVFPTPPRLNSIEVNTHYMLYIVTAGKGVYDSNVLNIHTNVTPSFTGIPTSFNIGSPVEVSISNPSSLVPTIRVDAQGEDGVWQVIHEESFSGVNKKAFTIPTAPLFSRTINRNTCRVRYWARVTTGGVNYDCLSQETTASVVNSEPTFASTPDLTPNANNPGFNGALGNPSIPHIVQRFGSLAWSFAANNAQARNSAVLRTAEWEVLNRGANTNRVLNGSVSLPTNGVFTVSIAENTLAPGDYKLRVQAVDSRGNRSAWIDRDFTVIAYSVPTMPKLEVSRYMNYEQNVSLSLEAVISRLTVGGTRRNAATISYRYQVEGVALPVNWETITGSTPSNDVPDLERLIRNVAATETTGFDNLLLHSSNNYNFEFRVRDTLGFERVVALTVAQGIPIMGIFDNGKVGIGLVPDMGISTPALQVETDIRAAGINLKAAIDAINSTLFSQAWIVKTVSSQGVTDANLLRTTGVYDRDVTMTNVPNNNGSFITVIRTSAVILQTFFDRTNRATSQRSSNDNGTTWSAWESHNQPALNLKANLASPDLTGTPTAPTAGDNTSTTQLATTAYVKRQFTTNNANAGIQQYFATIRTPTTSSFVFGMLSGWTDPGHISVGNLQQVINSWDGGVEIPNGNCRIRIGRFVIIIQSWQASTAMGVAWASASPSAAGSISTSTLGGGALGLTFASRPAFWLLGETPNTDHILVQTQGTTTNWPTFRIGQHGAQGTFTTRVNMIAIGRDR